MVLDKYTQLKEELVNCIDALLTIENITGSICEELREKIENNVFNLVVLGQFKRGKTTLINALLESIKFSKKVIEGYMDSEVKISPVSAKLALEGKLSGSKELLEGSFLAEFEHILNTFLMEEKGKVLLLSVTDNLLRLLSQVRLGLELEMKSLVTPLEELKDKVNIFEKEKKDVLSEKEDFSLLLDGEMKKIINNILEEDLKKFRHELVLKVSEDAENSYGKSSGISMKEIREYLVEKVITEVKQAFATWRSIEDEKLAKAFGSACKRFITKIDETVDSLLKFSAELFAVPFDIVKAEAIWSTKSSFFYRFKEQPVGIEIAASSLTLLMPKFIGEKIILKKVKGYLQRVIDIQTASVGCDFEERLNKSKLDFRWEMFQRIDTTVEGILKAIEKGMSMKEKGEKAIKENKAVLLETDSRLNEIKDKLMKIKKHLLL